MSLETVVDDIREEARQEAAAIREETEGDVEEILAEAEAAADEIVAEREAAVESRIEREREQALSSAKLEAKQERLSTRRDLLADLRDRLEEHVNELAGEKRRSLTEALLSDAIDQFSEDAPLEVRGAETDQDLLADLVADVDRASVAESTDCLGGVEVSSPDSRVTIDNTFDSVLDRMWDDELKRLSDRLFGDDTEQ